MLRLAWIILTAVPALLAGPVVVPDASTTEATPVTSIDCSNRDNGFYSIGCTQNFTECHLKKAYNKPCPKHLYFHSRLGRCEYKVDIPECRNPSQSAGIIFASPPEFQCGNRTDGFYSHPHIPCDKSYYVCLKGHVMRMACGYQQFYDVVKQRCEFKSRVPACKGKQISGRDYTLSEGSQSNQAPAAPSQVPYGQQTFSQDQTAPPASPPAEITSNKVTPNVQPHEGAPDCANLADGVFADTKVACSRFFWKCAHKTLFKYECPSELFYDKEVDRCDHKKFVPMCGGTRPATTPTPPAQDSVPVDFDCSGKTDGFHVKKRCDSTFYSCLAGTTQRLTCTAGLSFDDRVNYCDYPLACQQDRPETTRPPMDQSYNVIQSDPTAAPLPSVDFSCVGRNDGRFALGKCINDYVVCTNGNAMKMSCPASLLFDGTHCNFQDVCMSPPSTAQTADVPANPYGSVPQIPQDAPSSPKPPSYNPIPTVPVRTTTSPPTYAQTLPARSEPQAGGVNCVNLENGPQASERCSSNYVVCDNGLTVRQSCPHDLIYNPYEKSCDYKESVEGCGNGNNVGQDVPLVPVASTSAPQLTNPYGQAKPSQDKTADKCASLADGIYAEGCSNYYIQCLHGISYKQDCPAGLFYNRKTEICDHKQRVRACGGKEEISPVPTASLTADAPAYGVGSANDQPQVNTGNQCTETSIENSGCNTFYFQCVFGKIARMQCAPSLYYNPDEHICDWKKNIVACGGTAPTAAAAADEAVQTIPYSQKTGTILNQDSEADNFCMNKDNGFYAAGCQTFGYACVVGSTKRFNCPGGTYFNPDNNKCEWKENVPVCGGTSPTTAAPAQSPPAAAAAGGYNNLPIAEGAGALAADIPLKPFCERLADGYYADGCNSFFYYCHSGVTQRLNCPTGTFYHIRRKDCHRREDVPACNSQLVETTQQPAQSPSVPSSPYGSPAQQSPPSQPSFDCRGKQDGLYPLPECTPIFIQCYNQAVVKQSCQDGLFYNKENGMCDYRENVPACGGRIPATTTTTTTPAPVQQTPATARPYPAAAIAADTPLDATCTGKEDGYYADGCTSRYYSCQGGNIAQHSCQHNLRFDQIRLRCDFDENIEACGGKTPEEDTPATTAAPYGARQNIQQDTAQQASFDCKGKKDGLYPLSPCNKEYVACSNERVFTRQCNNGLFYDDDKKFCDFLARVAGCGAQPSQPAQSPALPSQPYGSSATPAPTLPSRDEISFDCSGKTDGFYETAVKCSINYVQCSNKIAYNGKCPEGLVFNIASGLCDYTASTAGCSNYVPATTQAPTQLPAQSQPKQPQQQYPDQQPLPTQPAQSQPQQPQQQYPGQEQTLPAQSQPIQQQTLPSQPAQSQQSPMTTQEFSCSGQPDGIYGSVCGTQYWKCSGGMTFPQKCSPNTVFDGVSGGCDFSAKIAACQNNGV